ncbi:GUN4 domain-containing protein [Arthrospira platensis]|uniref:GUN4 domain-containing protein n=1 Tax=Limnospira platensis TaxID=118562 RepID=UPI0024CCDC8F|nr:GUN4 domain-containing protein [Arthrospira platensis]WAK74006.1 GUN4 domain-containing protein [Arthrospira sp. PCC 9108]
MMAKCPVCETEYTPNEVETCSVCGYDLTPYPPIIGGIPSGFLEKEKKRIAAAKRVWQLSQSQVESAQLMVSHLQSQLDEMTRKIEGFTQSQSQLESQIEAIASQLQSQNEAIASQLQSQNEAIPSQSQSRLESQNKAIASQLQSLPRLESQIEAIASQLQSITEAVPDTPILSSSGFDYTELNRLLKSGYWKAADDETAKMMLAVARQTQRGYLDENDIKNFPGEDLRIIDGLWVKHSNGLFGFSVQKQIYINCGGKPDGSYPVDNILERFADEVGWRVNYEWLRGKDLTFSPWDAPKGHLPENVRYRVRRKQRGMSRCGVIGEYVSSLSIWRNL